MWQKDAEVDDPGVEEMCRVGTIAAIKQVMNLPGDNLRVLVEGEKRGILQSITQEEPYLRGNIKPDEGKIDGDEVELQALVRATQDFFETYAKTSLRVSQETVASVKDVDAADQIGGILDEIQSS